MENRPRQEAQYSKDQFQFIQKDERLTDKKLETRRIGYFGDVWQRFKRDKSAVVAFVLIMILLLFSVIVPLLSYTDVGFREENFAFMLPRLSFLKGTGFWDAAMTTTIIWPGGWRAACPPSSEK